LRQACGEGGGTIFARAVFKAYDVKDRLVWVADSFEGLPAPDSEKYHFDKDSKLHEFKILSVPLEKVKNNFERYELLDSQVRFLKGWFKDTLPKASMQKLAVIRLDADMYGSTTEALNYLYPKLSRGGYIIIDDYEQISACRQAVEDYRISLGINAEIKTIDHTGVYWKRD